MNEELWKKKRERSEERKKGEEEKTFRDSKKTPRSPVKVKEVNRSKLDRVIQE